MLKICEFYLMKTKQEKMSSKNVTSQKKLVCYIYLPFELILHCLISFNDTFGKLRNEINLLM